MHSDAKFVLVVEKEASFQRLMDDNVLQKLHPCIVITVSIYILGLLLSCFGSSSVLFRLNIWLTEEKCYYSPRFFPYLLRYVFRCHLYTTHTMLSFRVKASRM